MDSQMMTKADLLFQLKLLKDKAAAFESGEKYVRMQEEYRKNLSFQNRRNKQLEKELARSHAETASVRNKWFQACEDVLKEKDLELARMERKLREMEAEKFKALQQRDEALSKLHDKNVELYAVKTQLEEAQGKLLELTARLNRDYTNSSLSSSQAPATQRSRTAGRRAAAGPEDSRGISIMNAGAWSRPGRLRYRHRKNIPMTLTTNLPGGSSVSSWSACMYQQKWWNTLPPNSAARPPASGYMPFSRRGSGMM